MKKHTTKLFTVFLSFLITFWTYTNISGNQGEPGDSQFFRVYFDDKEMAIKQLQLFEVEAFEVSWEGQYHVMQLTPEDIDVLENLNYTVEPYFTYDPHRNRIPSATRPGTIPGYPSYKLVETTYEIAESLCTVFPKLATFVDGGDSWEKVQGSGGYDLMVLILTNSASELKIMAIFSARRNTKIPLTSRNTR